MARYLRTGRSKLWPFQVTIRPFPGMGCPKGVNAPAFWLTACDQGTDADDSMKPMFWETGPQGLPHSAFLACPSSIRAAAKRSGTVSRSHTTTVWSDMAPVVYGDGSNHPKFTQASCPGGREGRHTLTSLTPGSPHSAAASFATSVCSSMVMKPAAISPGRRIPNRRAVQTVLAGIE
jgi:hypothetical protein